MNINGNGLAFIAHHCCEVVHMDAETLFAQYESRQSVPFYKRVIISANRSSSVYNNSQTVQPNSIRVTYIIKFV